MKKGKKVLSAVLAAAMVLSAAPMVVSAAWSRDTSGSWNWTDNGKKATGWQMINGAWYNFNANGTMKTGWMKDSKGAWYYLEQSGAMKTGWLAQNGKWYYLKPSGDMSTNWVQSGDKWYHMSANGAMDTGFYTVGDKTYFSSGDGAMQSGVVEIDGAVYYFGESSDGAMQTGSVKIGNITYKFDETGKASGALKPKAEVAFSTATTPGNGGTVAPVEPTKPTPPSTGGGTTTPTPELSAAVKAVNAASTKAEMQAALEANATALGISVLAGSTYGDMDVSRKPSVANYVIDSKASSGYTSEAQIKAAFDAGVAYESGKWTFSEKLAANDVDASAFTALENVYTAHASYRSSIGKSVVNTPLYKLAQSAFSYVDGAGASKDTIITALKNKFEGNNGAGDTDCTNAYRLNSVFAWLNIHKVDAKIGLYEKEAATIMYTDLPSFYSLEYAKYVVYEEIKAAVPTFDDSKMDGLLLPANKTKFNNLKDLEQKWKDGNPVYVTEATYNLTTGVLTLTLSEDTVDVAVVSDAEKDRITIATSVGVVTPFTADSIDVTGTTVTITLSSASKDAVNAAISTAGGIGNAWVHCGDGAFLTDKGVPNVAEPPASYDTALKRAN